MQKTKMFWLLFSILIIASFLRLYHLSSLPPGLYPDEAMNGNNALEAIRTHDYKIFYPENNGREGLFINIQALFLKVIGKQSPWVLRLPSAIFGILTVFGVYFLAKELFSKNIGLLAAFFLATNFWHINFSRIGFRAIMAPLLLTWALYFLIKALRSENNFQFSIFNFQSKSNFPISQIYAGIAGIIYGLGFYTYIAYRITPLLFLALIPFFRKREGFWKLTAFFIGATFLTALPIGLYFLHNPADFFGRTTQISITSSGSPLKDLGLNIVKTIGMFFVKGDGNWRHNIADAPELFLPVALFFGIGTLLSLRNIKKYSPLLLISWLFLAALPVVVSNEGLPHALRSILMLPAVMILAGYGGIRLYESIRQTSIKYQVSSIKPILINSFSGIVLLVIAINGYYSYFITWGKNPNVQGAFAVDQVELGQHLNSLPREIPKYVVVETGGVDVRGMPMPTQTVMFITDTFLPEGQQQKNIFYVLPKDEAQIPQGAMRFVIQ